MKKFALFLIRFYRKNISPNTPPSCRYIPTCSQYAEEAFTTYGFFKAFRLTFKRISRCHPFNGQKTIEYDPVPKDKKGEN